MNLDNEEDWIVVKEAIKESSEVAVFGLLQLCVAELAKKDWRDEL